MRQEVSREGFKVVGRLSRSLPEGELANFEEPIVQAQYRHLVSGGRSKRCHCFHIVREANEEIVGFIALTCSTEDLGIRLNAFVSVDYAYVLPELRGQGL